MELALKEFDKNFNRILKSKKVVYYDKSMSESGVKLLSIYLNRIVNKQMESCWMRVMKNWIDNIYIVI